MADLTSNTEGLQTVLGMIDSKVVDTSQFQPVDADLTAIAGLTGTSGFLKKTGANAWTLDTNTYLTTASASSTYLSKTAASDTYLRLIGGVLTGQLVFDCKFQYDDTPHIQSKRDLFLQAGEDSTNTNSIYCLSDLNLQYSDKSISLGQNSQIFFEGITTKKPRIKYNTTYDAIEFIWS